MLARDSGEFFAFALWGDFGLAEWIGEVTPPPPPPVPEWSTGEVVGEC